MLLPDTDDFSPRTFDPDDELSEPESPLDRLGDWVEVTLDLGDGPQPYRRDTNVMPQWAGSCWYELRYCDPTNENAFVDPDVERYWMGPQTDLRPDHPGGVDLYVGGVEHAVLHLLYARFWHKVLFDLGHVSSLEPYARLFNQGYVLAAAYTDDRGVYVEAADVETAPDGTFTFEGQPVAREWGKMGKSLKNACRPGGDLRRLRRRHAAPAPDGHRSARRLAAVETRDVVGMYRFLQRLWRNVIDEETGEIAVADAAADEETRRRLHRTIDVVRTEIEALRFNTAIAKLIELNNHLTKLDAVPRDVAEPLVLMVAPFAPAPRRGAVAPPRPRRARSPTSRSPTPTRPSWSTTPWSTRCRSTARCAAASPCPPTPTPPRVEAAALADAKVAAAVDGATPKKVIVVPGRMVNVVV